MWLCTSVILALAHLDREQISWEPAGPLSSTEWQKTPESASTVERKNRVRRVVLWPLPVAAHPYREAEEAAQWLGARATLSEDLGSVQFLTPTLGGSQLPVTLLPVVPGAPTASFGDTHMHVA